MARRAEQLGYYSIWGNEHLTTPGVIRATLDAAANFYEPIVTFATLAGVTERLRFMLSVVVLPQRDPVLLAKQIATLDVLSGGRVMLGVGIGGYRDELEAVRPDLKGAPRGARAGRESPGAAPAVRRRRGQLRWSLRPLRGGRPGADTAPAAIPDYCSAPRVRSDCAASPAWPTAGSPPPRRPPALVASRQQLDAALVERGRDPASVETHQQVWLSFGRDRAEAEAKLTRSQHFRRITGPPSRPVRSDRRGELPPPATCSARRTT